MTEAGQIHSDAGLIVARPCGHEQRAGDAGERGALQGPEGAFSRSMAVSAIRCTLSYILIPYVFPLVGFRAGVGPWIGLPIGVAAILANVVSIRRFHRTDHRWKWPVSAINAAVIVLLTVLVMTDAGDLLR